MNKHIWSLVGAVIVGLAIGCLVWGGCGGHRRGHGGDMEKMDGMKMHSQMDSMTMELSGKTGDAFDEAFIDEMITHHQGAIEMAKMVLEVSKRPELIKLANEIIAAQSSEIKQMQEWKAAWFK